MGDVGQIRTVLLLQGQAALEWGPLGDRGSAVPLCVIDMVEEVQSTRYQAWIRPVRGEDKAFHAGNWLGEGLSVVSASSLCPGPGPATLIASHSCDADVFPSIHHQSPQPKPLSRAGPTELRCSTPQLQQGGTETKETT